MSNSDLDFLTTCISLPSYLEHAYPYDELRPLSCDGVDTWGSYSLTLIGVIFLPSK